CEGRAWLPGGELSFLVVVLSCYLLSLSRQDYPAGSVVIRLCSLLSFLLSLFSLSILYLL
ncbi:hypothetical protein V1524DRAFT_444234, partial [Lipomyces starkeyi]